MKNKKIMAIVFLIFGILIISGCELQLSQPKDKIFTSKINVENTLEGRVHQIYIDDFDNPQNSRLEWFIDSLNGIYSLRGVAETASLSQGDLVKIDGKINDNIIEVNRIIPLREGELAGPEFNLGENRILILIGEYGDLPFGYQISEVNQVIFGQANSIDDFYRENSYDQTWFSGDVIGPVYLGDNHPIGECNQWSDFSIMVEQLYEQADFLVDYTQYNRVAFVFGEPYFFCAGGRAEIGATIHDTLDGEVMQSWSYYLFNTGELNQGIYLFLHELGHNFGTVHADFVDCGDNFFGDGFEGCLSVDMGNKYALMGGAPPRHFTASNKHKLGWFVPEDWTYVNELPRTISLVPLELNMEGTKEIIIPYLTFNNSNEIPFAWQFYDDPIHSYYSLEYRQPIGYDVNEPCYVCEDHGIFIVLKSWPVESEPENPPWQWVNTAEHLIDTSPGDYNYLPQEDAVLLEGEEYYDNNIGIKIKVLSMNSSGAEIEIIKTKVPTWTECNTETHPEDCNDVCADLNTTCTEECTTISGVENAGAEIFIDVDDCSLDYSYESGCFNTIPSGSSRHCCCLIESVGEPEPPTGGGKALPHQQYIGEEDSQLSKESIFTKIINIIKNILTAKIK